MIPLIKREVLNSQQQRQQQTAMAASTKTETPAHCVLAVTQQPPQKWYKDQFGRKATFDVRVQRVGHGCAACVDQRHLAVQLLYENGCVV